MGRLEKSSGKSANHPFSIHNFSRGEGGRRMTRRLTLLLIAALIAGVCGCATPAPRGPAGPFVWPLPPEEPRIVFLESIRGEADFQEHSFLDKLFGAPPAAPLMKPYGVYAAGEKIYVAQSAGASVAVIDRAARKVTSLRGEGAASLSQPLGVAGTAGGMVFVSDTKLQKVLGFNAEGRVKVAIGKRGEMDNPVGLAVNDELKRLYVADSKAHKVRVYSLDGQPLFQFGEGGEKDGKFLFRFGETGDRPGQFARPRGVGVDSEGHVYVADAAFNNVQIFDENARLLLFFGRAGRDEGAFFMPAGVSVDGQDRIYVVDQWNSRVQVFQYLSEAWKKEHPEEYQKYKSLE